MADTPTVNKTQSNVVDDFLAALFASNPTPTLEKKPQSQPKSPQQTTATLSTTSTTSPKDTDNDQQGGDAAGTTKRAEILDEFDEYEMLSKRKHEAKDSTANARKSGKAGFKPKKAAKKVWPEARLLVRGIPHTAKKRDVLKHFNKYGNIVESHFGGNGMDYIQFDSPASCSAALAENGTNIKGSTIELDVAANPRPFVSYENSTQQQQHQQVPFRTGNKFSSRGGGNAPVSRGRGRMRGAGHFQPYSVQHHSQQQVPEYDPTDYSMWNGGYRENYTNQQQQQQQQQPLYENNSFRGKRGGRQGMRGSGRGKLKGVMARQQHQRHPSPSRSDPLSVLQNRDAPMIQVLAYGHVDQGFINYVESSFAIRHITTHTLFVQYGQISREDIVKQLILQGVKALVVLDQGKESMRKLYLQVFERNTSGANSYRFDEYDSVSVDEAIAVIERSQQATEQPQSIPTVTSSTAQAAYQAQQLLMQQQPRQPPSTQAQAISSLDPNTLASVIGLLKNMVQPTTQQQQQQQQQPPQVPVSIPANPTYTSQPMAQQNPPISLSQLQQLLGSALGTSFSQPNSGMTTPSPATFNQVPTTFPSSQPQHVSQPAYLPQQQQSIPTSTPNLSISDLLQKLQSVTQQQQMQHQ